MADLDGDAGRAASTGADAAAPNLKAELDALLGGEFSSELPAERRDYVGEALAAAQQLADAVVASVAPHLPPDVAALLRQHSFAVVAALVLLLLALGLGALRAARSGPRRSALLLCGPEGSGKTTMFYQLRQTPLPRGSVTSMAPNSDTFSIACGKVKTRPLEVVDLPGHPRLRSLFEQHCRSARAVVFVLDSAEYVKQKTDIAGQLYDILVSLASTAPGVPVLLACNKSDQGSRAFSTSFIVSSVEKDVRALRESRLAGVGHDIGARDSLVGKPGAEFAFATCPVRVSSCSVSALEGTLDGVTDFVQSVGF